MSGKPLIRFVLGSRQCGKTEAQRAAGRHPPVVCPIRDDACAQRCEHASRCKERAAA